MFMLWGSLRRSYTWAHALSYPAMECPNGKSGTMGDAGQMLRALIG